MVIEIAAASRDIPNDCDIKTRSLIASVGSWLHCMGMCPTFTTKNIDRLKCAS